MPARLLSLAPAFRIGITMELFGMDPTLAMILIVVLGLVVFGLTQTVFRRARGSSRDVRAILLFQQQREYLEADFMKLARSLGKPRGLRWTDCDWLPETRFARDRESGLLTAFVGVNVSFEAIEGGDMEDVEAVGMVRDATALFHYADGRWGTGGRALFNMHPDGALERLGEQFDAVAIPAAIQDR